MVPDIQNNKTSFSKPSNNKLLSKQKLLSNADRYTLVDCREEKEFLVSHIPDSLFLADFEKLLEGQAYRDKLPETTIFYCSIGYRSSLVAQRYKHLTKFVYNLHGGIFEYANNCHAVVDCKNKLQDRVHGYDSTWSQLLKPELLFLD